MTNGAQPSSLAAALVAAQAEFPLVGKSGENKYDRYRYATMEDFVDAIRAPLRKHGLGLVFSVAGTEALEPRQTKGGGTEYGARVIMDMTIVHSSGETMACHGVGDGYDRGDKAVYKAMTGARKYLVASALNLATSDDPEGDSTEREAAAPRPTTPAGNRTERTERTDGGARAAAPVVPVAKAEAPAPVASDDERVRAGVARLPIGEVASRVEKGLLRLGYALNAPEDDLLAQACAAIGIAPASSVGAVLAEQGEAPVRELGVWLARTVAKLSPEERDEYQHAPEF